MICSVCEGKNRDGARFCTYCGAALALRCTVCDTELVPGAKFCDSCGSSVDETAVAPAPAARKVVTVLFADLTGSTALEERMDAESVRTVLDRFYAAMRTEVERHSGRLVKFTGDGVMAAFGVPEVHEDDASRAIDAALSMRAECEELASDLSLALSLKIGINTGEVVVSASDDDVVGDSVNVASRFEGAASSGEVLVGEETWRLTRGTTRYEAIEPLLLKGKSEPVPAYRLLSVDERTADSATAPFVGRDRELAVLLTAFDEAVDENAARLVTIIGSPGLGKTRLARELTLSVEGRARVRETRCDPAGAATFAPIADALREATGITEAATEDDILTALAARIPEDDPDRERIAARAAAILGVGRAGSTEETFWAIRRLIEAAASIQPVVLILDDLHWAEPLLLDLVEHLSEWIRSAPVLLVGTGRPELRDIRPSLAEGGRAAAVIALEGLDQRSTATLALNLLGTDELPSELLAKIPASTEGNPLFVRELVRMLVDDGVLLRAADGWTVTVDVEAIQVPPTIQSLLAARVDRLRSDERTVIELAAVIGKEFYRGAICDLAPAAVSELVDGCLESLRRKELVEPVGTYWIDEPVYRFHHVLIRDAAYRRLLKESRAELHERVADWLERKTAGVVGEHDELLGYHLEQAHEYKRQLGRPDEILGRRAGALLGAAAFRALDRDDLPAAATLSGRALGVLPADDPDRPEVLLVRCEALLSMRDVHQGATAVSELQDAADTPRLAAWARCFEGHLATFTTPERLVETEEKVAAAAAELTTLGDQAGAAKAHTVLAMALGNRGRFAESETVLDAALTAARAANDRRRITATLGMAPHAALWGPSPVSRAGGRCLDIVRLLRITTGSPAVEATSLRCQAVLEALRGRADAARRMLRSARRTLTELGLQREILEADQFSGIVELLAGDPAAALPHLRASVDGSREFGIHILAAQSAALLARAHLALGETEEAEALVAVSDELANEDIKTSIDALSVRAELLARRGEFGQARRAAEAAVAIAERTDALFDHGNAYRSLAVVLRAAGDADGAQRAEERAHALFERKGATALMVGAQAIAAGQTPEPASSAQLPDNDCVSTARRFIEAYERRDWNTVIATHTEDVTFDDRRKGLRAIHIGLEAAMNSIRGMADVGVTRVDPTVIATRGLRLALLRIRFSGDDPDLYGDVLNVVSVGPDNRQDANVLFDPQDLDAAFAELDERYLLGEAAEFAAVLSPALESLKAFNERDWARFEGAMTDDHVFVDHRPASMGRIVGPAAFVEASRTLIEMFASARSSVVVVHAVGEDRALSEIHGHAVTADGSELEVQFLALSVVRDGRISRTEYFPVEERLRARARFAELEGGEAQRRLENRCARTVDQLNVMYAAKDWTKATELLAMDVIFEDRRSGLGARVEGRDAFIELMKLTFSVVESNRRTVVAVRGQSLALLRNMFQFVEGYEIETLVVFGCNDVGLIDVVTVFDTTDLDDAIGELDARFDERLGRMAAAPPLENAAARAERSSGEAVLAQRWDIAAGLLSPDSFFEDRHKGLGLTLRGREAVLEFAKAVRAVGVTRSEYTAIAIRGERLALARRIAGGDPGRDFETEALTVTELDEEGLIAATLLFDPDDLDAAFTELDERYIAGEGAAWAEVLSLCVRQAWGTTRVIGTRIAPAFMPISLLSTIGRQVPERSRVRKSRSTTSKD